MFVVPCNETVLSSWTGQLLPVILNGAASSCHPERSRRRSEGSGPQLRHVILNEVKDLG